jgi:cytochrome c-type biogenesis protein CcmH
MIVFWAVAGLLAAGALMFVLPPLLRAEPRRRAGRSQDEANVEIHRDRLRELDSDLAAGTIDAAQYAAARQEIERRVLEDTGMGEIGTAAGRRGGMAAGLAILLPASAILLYMGLGELRGLDPDAVRAPVADSPHEISSEQIAGMVSSLAARLKDRPDDAEGWVMLGRSYAVLQRHQEAAAAYARAVALVPGDAQLLVDYADALAMAQERNLQGEPERLILRALALDPSNPKALALAGTVAFQKGDYPAAIARWQAMLEQLPAESELAAAVRASIAEAEQKRATGK